MTQSEFRDLTNLARDRVRQNIESVAQLMDPDAVPAMILAVAVDLIEGTVACVRQLDRSLSEAEALGEVFSHLVKGIGIKEISAALTADIARRKKERSGS